MLSYDMEDIVVIDTSVVISALIGKNGPGREVLRRCLKSQFKPIISNTLFAEYQDVAIREKILEICPLNKDEIQELLNAFYSVCRWVQVYYLWRPNLKDENDNFIIELALAGNARTIITNNIRDFKNSELKFPELDIITPEKLLMR